MSDIFVSYARSDEPQSLRVADALKALGYRVWRDDELPAHRPYADVIQERLREAKAVVVMWSAHAAKSQWVRSEADAARQFGTLVQATMDGSVPPMPFDQIQCANLREWDGDDGAGWQKLMGSVRALAGDPRDSGTVVSARGRKQQLSVCVLPFANMSGDPEQEYFSDGISEDITTDLSKVSALSVVARNTAFTFKGKAVDVGQLVARLGVSHVLEGSVRKSGDRVRITAQLIDGATGDHLWAERYDRDLTDIFAIQDELSKAIVEALRLELLPEEKKAIESRGTADADAYNLYLRARQLWITGAVGRLGDREIIRIARQALALDPDYAEALALMALAQTDLRFFHGEQEDGRPAAERALELNPDLPEPHCVNARHLAHDGRTDEAEAAIQSALRLRAESWEVNREAARLLFGQGRHREAIPYLEKAMALVEGDFHSGDLLIACYSGIGDGEAAKRTAVDTLDRSKIALEQDPANAIALAAGAKALLVLGKSAEAMKWTDRALRLDPDNVNLLYNLACNLAFTNSNLDGALDLLERFFERSTSATFLKYADADPDLDSLREHSRFRQMMSSAKQRLIGSEGG